MGGFFRHFFDDWYDLYYFLAGVTAALVGHFIGQYRLAARARRHIDTGFLYLERRGEERAAFTRPEIKIAFDPSPEYVGIRRREMEGFPHDGDHPNDSPETGGP